MRSGQAAHRGNSRTDDVSHHIEDIIGSGLLANQMLNEWVIPSIDAHRTNRPNVLDNTHDGGGGRGAHPTTAPLSSRDGTLFPVAMLTCALLMTSSSLFDRLCDLTTACEVGPGVEVGDIEDSVIVVVAGEIDMRNPAGTSPYESVRVCTSP